MTKGNIEGLVLKVTDDHIVLMCTDGTFQNIPRDDDKVVPSLGEHYIYTEKKKVAFSHWLNYAVMVSLFLLAIVSYAIFPFGANDSSYIVAVDINPSIELSLNEKMKVLGATANNPDGEKLILTTELEGLTLDHAFQKIVSYSVNEGIFEKANLITTSVIAMNGKGKANIIENVEIALQDTLIKNQVEAKYVVSENSKLVYDEAKSYQVSVNQYALYKELESKGFVASFEEVKGKSLAELKQMQQKKIKENKDNKENKKDKKGQTNQRKKEDSQSENNNSGGVMKDKNGNGKSQGKVNGNEKNPSKQNRTEMNKQNRSEKKNIRYGGEKSSQPKSKNDQSLSNNNSKANESSASVNSKAINGFKDRRITDNKKSKQSNNAPPSLQNQRD